MKKKSVKLLVALACALMTLGMAGCGKKAYKTFPEKYKLASVDVGGMTADEAKKAIDRKSTRLNSSHNNQSRMPSSA